MKIPTNYHVWIAIYSENLPFLPNLNLSVLKNTLTFSTKSTKSTKVISKVCFFGTTKTSFLLRGYVGSFLWLRRPWSWLGARFSSWSHFKPFFSVCEKLAPREQKNRWKNRKKQQKKLRKADDPMREWSVECGRVTKLCDSCKFSNKDSSEKMREIWIFWRNRLLLRFFVSCDLIGFLSIFQKGLFCGKHRTNSKKLRLFSVFCHLTSKTKLTENKQSIER